MNSKLKLDKERLKKLSPIHTGIRTGYVVDTCRSTVKRSELCSQTMCTTACTPNMQ
jgi:hypothetical protein